MVPNTSIPYLGLSKLRVSKHPDMQSKFCRPRILYRTSNLLRFWTCWNSTPTKPQIRTNMDDPPPPYTNILQQDETTTTHTVPQSITRCIHRFLLDSVSFAYGVSSVALSEASHIPVPTQIFNTQSPNRASILSLTDHAILLDPA
jgi:hypothetical protein